MKRKRRRRYRRLSAHDRERISRWLAKKKKIRWIARKLKRAPSTISREIRGGSMNRWTYRAVRAEDRARRNAGNRKHGKYKLLADKRLQKYVHEKLRLHWSPEQIVQCLHKDHPGSTTMRVSSEAIYSYLYVLPRGELKRELLSCLRRRHKRRHKQSTGIGLSPKKIQGMISIEERPKDVEKRTVPGHWEGDLLIGRNRQSALGSLVERTTRTTILVKLKKRDALTVRRAFARKARRLPAQMKLSMTYDQGREMAQHRLFTKQTQMKVYFAHPASPWERGTNENTNGLIRDFFPKGTDFNTVPLRKINRVQHLLNGRPRKVLNWSTPYEAFQNLTGVALKN